MRTLSIVASLGLVVTGLTGCGLFKLSTNLGTSGGSGDAPSAANYDEGSAKESVAKTFKSWTFESCKDFDCVGKFRQAAGISEYKDAGTYVYYFNPRRAMDNPDATWLTGWSNLPADEHANESDKVYQALVLAAGSRSWLARCHADFDGVAKEAATAHAKATDLIDKAKGQKNVYSRIQALLDARATIRKTEGGDYVSNLVNKVGSVLDVETALKKAYDDSGRDYLYAIDHVAPDAGHDMRARDTDEKERDMYCSRAYGSGTSKTPEAVQRPGSSYFSGGSPAVKPVFSAEESEALTKNAQDLEARALASFATKDFKKVGYGTVAKGDGEIAGHPKLAFVEREKLPVTAVKRDGTKWILELKRHDDGTFPYDCVPTNRINRIMDDGTIDYVDICKDGKETWDTLFTITVSADDLPEGVAFEVGDELVFYGKVVSYANTQNVKSKALHTHDEKGSFELSHLVSLRRKGKSVGRWF